MDARLSFLQPHFIMGAKMPKQPFILFAAKNDADVVAIKRDGKMSHCIYIVPVWAKDVRRHLVYYT